MYKNFFKKNSFKKTLMLSLVLVLIFFVSLKFESSSNNKILIKKARAETQKIQVSDSNTATTSTISSTTVSTKSKYSKTKQDIVQAWVWRIVKRYQTAMDRLIKISERIETRAKKLKNSGLNTYEINKKIKLAKSEINKSGDNIILAASQINDIFKQDDPPKESFEIFKDYALKAKQNITNSKNLLIESVELIKLFKVKNN